MDIKENTKDEVIERNTEDDISSNDRSSWTKSLSKRGGKIMQRLLSRPRTNSMSSISQGEKETSPRVKTLHLTSILSIDKAKQGSLKYKPRPCLLN